MLRLRCVFKCSNLKLKFEIILLGIISIVCIARTSVKSDSGPITRMTIRGVAPWAWGGVDSVGSFFLKRYSLSLGEDRSGFLSAESRRAETRADWSFISSKNNLTCLYFPTAKRKSFNNIELLLSPSSVGVLSKPILAKRTMSRPYPERGFRSY